MDVTKGLEGDEQTEETESEVEEQEEEDDEEEEEEEEEEQDDMEEQEMEEVTEGSKKTGLLEPVAEVHEIFIKVGGTSSFAGSGTATPSADSAVPMGASEVLELGDLWDGMRMLSSWKLSTFSAMMLFGSTELIEVEEPRKELNEGFCGSAITIG